MPRHAKKVVPPSGSARRTSKPKVLGTLAVNRKSLIDAADKPAVLAELKRLLALKPSAKVRKSLLRSIEYYNDVGPTNLIDDVVSVKEAPFDIPPLALKGFQFLERRVRIYKSATFGTTAGGFNAILAASDLAGYSAGSFRIKRIVSWTAPTNAATESQFAGLLLAGSSGSDGTEALPTWVENFTRIGSGYAGLDVSYPLGDFLLFTNSATTTIATHFTGLGGAQGVSGIPVVFDVWLECLI